MQSSRTAAGLLFLLAAMGCGDKRPPTARKTAPATEGKAVVAGTNPWADTGRVIDGGISTYAVIADTACPGTRIVGTRFEVAQGLIVGITESNTQRSCVEGTLSNFVATVHASDGGLVASIRGGAHSLGVVDVRDAVGDPLLVGDVYFGGSGPDELEYWNLRTGELVFHDVERLQAFAANGKIRYLAMSGGNGDTLGVVEYGDARGKPQRVVFTRGLLAGAQSGANFQVGHDTLEGPRSFGRVAIGGERDTVPIRGVTLRFHVSDVYVQAGVADYELVAAIVDDRLVAQPVKTSGQP